MYCKISLLLAYAMSVYCLSCSYYLIKTMWVGTPFKNSLTEKQLIIKKESAKVRRNIFIEGLIVGLLVIIIFRPFNKC